MYIPSLPIQPFYFHNTETKLSAQQMRNAKPAIDPKEYYKRIRIIGKEENDANIIRKLRDIQPNKREYPKFHFLINQYNKIYEGTPINRICEYSEDTKDAIIIKLNTEITGRTARILNYLLKDLKNKYGIEDKHIISDNDKPVGRYFVADFSDYNWGKYISERSNGIIKNIRTSENVKSATMEALKDELEKVKNLKSESLSNNLA